MLTLNRVWLCDPKDCSPIKCVKEEPKIYLSVSLKFFLKVTSRPWNSFKFFVFSLNRLPNLFFFFFCHIEKKNGCVHLFLQVCVYLPSRDWPAPQALDQVGRGRSGPGLRPPAEASRQNCPSSSCRLSPCCCFCQDLSCVVFLCFGSLHGTSHCLGPTRHQVTVFPFLHVWKCKFFKITKECDSLWKVCTVMAT